MEEDLEARQTSLVVVMVVSSLTWNALLCVHRRPGIPLRKAEQGHRGPSTEHRHTSPRQGQWLWTRSTRSSTNVHGVMFSVYFHFCSLRCNHVRLTWPKPNESNCKILEKAHIWHWSSSLLYVNRGSFLFFFLKRKTTLFWNNCRLTSSYKNSTEQPCVLMTQLTPKVTSHVTVVYHQKQEIIWSNTMN